MNCFLKEGRDVVVQLLMKEEGSTMRLHDENMSPGASWCSISYGGN